MIFAYEIVLPCIFMGLSQHGDLVSDILATPPCKAPSKGAVGEPSPSQPAQRPARAAARAAQCGLGYLCTRKEKL